MTKVKEYTNGEVTIVWKPDLCIHSKNCIEGLSTVFEFGARPWIKPNGANSQTIVDQVKNCPSGALSTYINSEGLPAAAQEVDAISVKIKKNGPVLVHGNLKITHSDGSEIEKSGPVALCRCGHSQKKPFCDGSHNRIGFIG